MKVRGNQVIERLYATRMPAPFLSVLTDDCIAKGRDYNAGGARYNNTFIQAVGIGTVTDALAAIRRLVYEEKALPLAGPRRGARRRLRRDASRSASASSTRCRSTATTTTRPTT